MHIRMTIFPLSHVNKLRLHQENIERYFIFKHWKSNSVLISFLLFLSKFLRDSIVPRLPQRFDSIKTCIGCKVIKSLLSLIAESGLQRNYRLGLIGQIWKILYLVMLTLIGPFPQCKVLLNADSLCFTCRRKQTTYSWSRYEHTSNSQIS